MNKSKQGNFRLTGDEFTIALRAAEIERQSFSEYIRNLLRADLRAKGLWPPPYSVEPVPKVKKVKPEPKHRKHRWTPNEDKILCQYASTQTAKEIMEMLPHHSLSSIYIRSYALGVSIKRSFTLPPLNGRLWTSEEEDALRKHVDNKLSAGEIAVILDRSREAIKKRANKMGIKLFDTQLQPTHLKKKADGPKTENPVKPIDMRYLSQLREAGVSYKGIGDMYGLSAEDTYLRLKRYMAKAK